MDAKLWEWIPAGLRDRAESWLFTLCQALTLWLLGDGESWEYGKGTGRAATAVEDSTSDYFSTGTKVFPDFNNQYSSSG